MWYYILSNLVFYINQLYLTIVFMQNGLDMTKGLDSGIFTNSHRLL